MSEPKSPREIPSSRQTAFNDPIHGTIMLHPLLVKVINTPQFQRLRYLKQLGTVNFVYPGASHNRFEHCIGTAYLAGEFCRILKRNHELDNKSDGGGIELNITDRDILCVEMAGLCHDLGHGPFSHMFDNRFLQEYDRDWKHEDQSCKMMRHLLDEGNMIRNYDETDDQKFSEKEIKFIEEMINGPKENMKDKDWKYEGLDVEQKNKEFLYDIISNQVNKVDVDKWDYFARDCHYVGMRTDFDHMRFMKFARVCKVNENTVNGKTQERTQICLRDKEVYNLYRMFETRYALHRRVYQHKVSNGIGIMIGDALKLANDRLTLARPAPKGKKISDAVKDPSVYTYLTDSVLNQIVSESMRAPEDLDLKASKEIVERIHRRDLYKCIGVIIPDEKEKGLKYCETIKQEIIKNCVSLMDVDLELDEITFNYGMNEENPIKYYRFFNKQGKLVSQDEMKKYGSTLLPASFQEREVRVYCKKKEKFNDAKKALESLKQVMVVKE